MKFILSVIVLIWSLSLIGCSGAKEEEAEPVAPVQVAEARIESIERVVSADGILRALTQSSVTPKISSPVSRFYVDRGDRVRKNQLLATLENRDLAAAVAEAKGAYEQAAAAYRNLESASVPEELVKAQADVQAAEQALDAARKLRDSREQLYREGALARRLVEEASVAYAQAKSQFDTARRHQEAVDKVGRHEEIKAAAAQLDSARAKYEASQAQLSYSEIRSPIDGVVAERPAFPGEMAGAGTPLITVMDVSSVIARVNVPPTEAAFIRTGQAAQITTGSAEDGVAGKVTVVSPAVDQQSTTVEIWIQAANPERRLRPGMSVHVEISAGYVSNAVVVPAAALLPSTEGGAVVMVVGRDSLARERKAEPGVRDGGKVQLLRGVSPGENVVVAGGVGLRDGAKVSIAKAGHE